MSEDRKQELAEARKQGLTYDKVAADRMAAFEVGTELFIEKAGFNEKTASEFRTVLQQGVEELQQNPELVKQALAEAGLN